MKRIPVRTRSFGAEIAPPEREALAPWVRERRGLGGDLILYQIMHSLALQEGIDSPCAGGMFYGDRVAACLAGVTDRTVTGEIDLEEEAAIADVIECTGVRKGAWFALPAPSLLGLSDAYFHDREEMTDEVVRAYRLLMREMRDAGAGGHVLIADTAEEIELEGIGGKRICFFPRQQDEGLLAAFLEHQALLIVGPDQIRSAARLAEEYEVREVSVLHPTHDDLTAIAAYFDSDAISAGGYTGEGEEGRWKSLREEAYLIR
ncbi:hypothetical protein [Methanofollis fontis]|uniref:Uncharacterized protein n=1 Tax=Methanofollis fontis TaxID=2052832 RepID=A0A483CXW9_9EURY|nr:hypothetical protein [Methanofollis fontis]TAJ44859.1 hypothetical protein CUJ86_06115 [Methanofollis fontis]